MRALGGHLAFPLADPLRARRLGAAGQVATERERAWAAGPLALWNCGYSSDAVAVALCGRLENARELRQGLVGGDFPGEDPCELLAHLYARDGARLLEKLRGPFALALWDARRRELILARDRFGQMPLVYAWRGRELFFASNLAALQAGAPEALGGADPISLGHYLELGYVPAPRTLIFGASKLAAGTLLLAGEHGGELRRWHLLSAPGSGKSAPVAAELRSRLSSALISQLESAPASALLSSGGLQSASLVALASAHAGEGLRTLAVGFSPTDPALRRARSLAEHFHTAHRELLVEQSPLEQAEAAFATSAEPLGHAGQIRTAALLSAVARDSSPVLSGLGGRQLFAGQALHRTLWRLSRVPALPASQLWSHLLAGAAHKATLALGQRGEPRARALGALFTEAERDALLGKSLPMAPGAGLRTPTDLDAALAFELLGSLPDGQLCGWGAAADLLGVDHRAPLLSPALFDLVVPAPAASKVSWQRGELLLRAALGERLPREVLEQPRHHPPVPLRQWLRGPLWPMLRDLCGAPTARLRKWIDGRLLERLVDDAEAGRGQPEKAFALLALEQWARRHSL